MELNDTIRRIRRDLGLTQEGFALQLGIKRSLLGAYEEGRAEPRLELLQKIAKLADISLEALLKGKTDKPSAPAIKEGNIQLVPVKAAAGYLRGFEDQDVIRDLPNFTLPMLGKGNYRAFEIIGDSMKPLASGTVVVGEYVESSTGLKSGKTYVLVTKRDGIVYKRVFNYLKENGKLFLVSHNLRYKPYSIDPEEILEAWLAKAYISIDFPENDIDFNPAKAS